MGQIKNNIAILGTGKLSEYLKASFSKTIDFNVINLSIRNNEFPYILDILSSLSDCVIIDSMDPSNKGISDYNLIQKEVNGRRESLICLDNISQYCYISSALVYPISRELINEDNLIHTDHKDPYIYNKIITEAFLSKSIIPNKLSFFRPVSLWDISDLENDTFFGDLFKSRAKNFQLDPRSGDDQVFSYMSKQSAAKILSFHIKRKIFRPITNITLNIWNSRSGLKNLKSNDCRENVGLRTTTRYYDVSLFVDPSDQL